MKTIAFKSVSLLALCAGAALVVRGAALTVPGAKCVIVTDFRDQSVAELQQHIELICGRKPPVYSSAEAAKKLKGGEYVWRFAVAPDDKKGETYAGEEGRYRITPQGAWIWGGPNHGAERGGLYPMLEEALGARWPWPGTITVPHQGPDIEIYRTEGGWKSPFLIHAVRMAGDRNSVAWRNRMRVAGGGANRPAYGHAWSEYWYRFGWNQEHPEYFAMRKDGKRMPVNVSDENAYSVTASHEKPAQYISMCVSCEAFVDQVVADWKEAGAKNWINLCENDAQGNAICFCPNCLKLDEPDPPDADPAWRTWYADRYINFCHRVLAKAKKINPDVRAVTYSYNAMEKPPRREKVTDDILVGFAPDDYRVESLKKLIYGWKKVGMKQFFYRPNRRVYYAAPSFPVGFEKHFYDLFRIIYDAGECVGFDHDGTTPETILGMFPDYVLAKTMQDPTKSFEHWESHYFDAFGPAKEDVRAYFRYWRDEVWAKRIEGDISELMRRGLCSNVTRGLVWNLDKYYSFDDFETAGASLAAAAKRTDLNASQKAALDQLLAAHECAAVWVRAVVDRNEDNTRELMARRKGLPYREKYWGDICGVMRLAVPAPANFHPETKELLIVDCGHPEATAELKLHLDRQLSADIPVVKGEATVTTNTFNLYVGRVPHLADPHLTDFQPPEEGYWIFPNKGRLRTGYFYGPDDRAVRNAVHDFVEFELGARWPWEDEVAIKKQPNLRVYTWKNAWHPYLRLAKRTVTFRDEPKSAIFAERHCNGEHAIDPKNENRIPATPKTVKVETAFRAGGEKEAFDAWQASYNESESFAYEYVLPKPKTVFDWHVAYILDKAMRDPYKSFGFWESHYLQSFGAAAREMRQFFKALRDRKDGSAFLEAALGRADLEPDDRRRVERVKADYSKIR